METHDRPGFPWWLAVLLMFAIAAGVGVFTFNLGLAQGVAQSSPVAAAPGAAPPAPLVHYHPLHWHYGFGFAPLMGLFWIFLIFALMRRVWWGPRWYRRGYYGHYYGGIPPEFEEWHRRAHDPNGPPKTTQL